MDSCARVCLAFNVHRHLDALPNALRHQAKILEGTKARGQRWMLGRKLGSERHIDFANPKATRFIANNLDSDVCGDACRGHSGLLQTEHLPCQAISVLFAHRGESCCVACTNAHIPLDRSAGRYKPAGNPFRSSRL
jgi:hypothetical protein